MENRNNILNELREMSPVVAGIGHLAPYTVPAGYFEGLAGRLLLLVKAEAASPVLPPAHNPYQVPQGYFDNLANNLLQRVKGDVVELSPALQQANKNAYQVPQGYFEGFASNMLQRIKAGETVTLSTALQQAGNNPYQVPQGYFDTLATNLLQRVKENETTLSIGLQQAGTNPYTVPQGYFDSLPAIVLNRVNKSDDASDELETLSPLLNSIGKKMPFSTPEGYFDDMETLSPLMNGLRRCYVYEVPAGYFNQLPAQVLKAVKAQQPAKVVSMSFTRKVVRLAAAAVVAGLIVTAGLLFLNNPGGKAGSDGNNATVVAAAGELDNISDEMLEKYLENQTSTTPETPIAAVAIDELNASDMKDMLADVTDADLQQYLEKYSTVKDIQTN